MLDNSIKLDLWPWVWKIGKAKAPDIHTLHITYLWFCGSCKFYLTNFVKSRKYKLCVMSATITRHEARTWKFHCSVSAIKLYAQRTREWGRAEGEKKELCAYGKHKKSRKEKKKKSHLHNKLLLIHSTLWMFLFLFSHYLAHFIRLHISEAWKQQRERKKSRKKCFFFLSKNGCSSQQHFKYLSLIIMLSVAYSNLFSCLLIWIFGRIAWFDQKRISSWRNVHLQNVLNRMANNNHNSCHFSHSLFFAHNVQYLDTRHTAA